MSISDSMFLFEIAVEELVSFVTYRDFSIVARFADLFNLQLKNPEKTEVPNSKKSQKKCKQKKVRNTKAKEKKTRIEPKVELGQSVLVANHADSLKFNMIRYPLQLTLGPKNDPEYVLGSTTIPWQEAFINYLNDVLKNRDVPSVTVEGSYNVFDEISSKRMVSIKLSIKLSFLKDGPNTETKFLSEGRQAVINTDLNQLNNSVKREYVNETGTIKTIYSGGKKFKPSKENKNKTSTTKTTTTVPAPAQSSTIEKLKKEDKTNCFNRYTEIDNSNKFLKTKSVLNDNLVTSAKSNIDLDANKQVPVIKSKSDSLEFESHLNTLNYIFGDNKGPYGDQLYYVGYCTVQNDGGRDTPSTKVTTDSGPSQAPSESTSVEFSVIKCDNPDCNTRPHRVLPPPPDDRILIDLTNANKECCNLTEEVEEVAGGMTAKLTMGKDPNDPCFCTCECTFGFTKKTYCTICGGYELGGDANEMPCPAFHKLMDKKKKDKKLTEVESGKGKNCKKILKDERFKFNYGYQAPQIGHSQCAIPCTGTLSNVPKSMGWLWTAEDVPGLKFRPSWKPGATNKHVVRLLKMAKNPGVVAKKRRKETGKKRPLKRPLLVVHKKSGEYEITMETMKVYTKPRAVNQHPYEDKPVVTYTIGRSEEENRERLRKKERVQRRLERAQRYYIQSAFKDMCKDICLKTYQQALGILPDAEDPECTCYPAEPGPDRTNLDVSCSCSEDSRSLGSTTDSDEWIVEFTPPNALFDQSHKGKRVVNVDNTTQYTYLDYRVKLNDRYGNPVPRFFKGLDGRQQCSDLGGFWGPDHTWLEINVDGFIAPDNRWAPFNFLGPNGEQVDTEDGTFQATNGKMLTIGIDGYIDSQGRWRFYSKPRASPQKKVKAPAKKDKKLKKGDILPPVSKISEATWSCFGDASPKELGKIGIVGHGPDRQLLISILKDMMARGEDVTIPQPTTVPRRPQSKKGKKSRPDKGDSREAWNLEDRTKCRHPVPSDKGVLAVDARGNKTYFKMKNFKNKRPKERMHTLSNQGISLSSFHAPCFHSFINSEVLRQQQRDRHQGQVSRGKSVAIQHT